MHFSSNCMIITIFGEYTGTEAVQDIAKAVYYAARGAFEGVAYIVDS